jgi:hypothetical protein
MLADREKTGAEIGSGPRLGVHSAGVRLSSHGPGGCKSRYLHLPVPSTRIGHRKQAPFHKGPPLSRVPYQNPQNPSTALTGASSCYR